MSYNEIVKALKKDGWRFVRSEGSHHQFKHPGHDKVVTVPRHSGRDVSIGVLKNIERVTGLSLRR